MTDYHPYYPAIGIECHVQLKTKTKLFAPIEQPSTADLVPNQLVSPLCLGLPGTLPVLNRAAVDLAILAGLALGAEIAEQTRFDRKHYFYPDLPLGYQISQHDQPIIKTAQLTIPLNDQHTFKVRLQRAHLEADAGKLTHQADSSLVDLNRVGTPLLEIVSLPDMQTPLQAKQYARELYLTMIHAGVCDGDLFAGNLRFDVNVSVSRQAGELGVRTEIKNLNSFRFIEQAVAYEIKRQIDVLEAGQTVQQETLGFNEVKKQTFSQRSKEDAQDYRYMPDPDLPPVVITAAQIAELQQQLPPTPTQLRQQLQTCAVPFNQAETLLDLPELSPLIGTFSTHAPDVVKLVVNWLLGDILYGINQQTISWRQVLTVQDQLFELANLQQSQKITSVVAKKWLPAICRQAATVSSLFDQWQQQDAFDCASVVRQVLAQQSKAVADAQKDPKAIGFLIGCVMQASANQADPQQVAQLIKQFLQTDAE